MNDDQWYQFWVRKNWHKAHSENAIDYVRAPPPVDKTRGKTGFGGKSSGPNRVHIVRHRNTAQHTYSRATTRVPCGVVGAAGTRACVFVVRVCRAVAVLRLDTIDVPRFAFYWPVRSLYFANTACILSSGLGRLSCAISHGLQLLLRLTCKSACKWHV